MSTGPTPTPESQSTTDPQTTTEIAARGRVDPWTAGEDAGERQVSTTRAQRQFDPCSRSRMRNLVDEENAYCN